MVVKGSEAKSSGDPPMIRLRHREPEECCTIEENEEKSKEKEAKERTHGYPTSAPEEKKVNELASKNEEDSSVKGNAEVVIDAVLADYVKGMKEWIQGARRLSLRR